MLIGSRLVCLLQVSLDGAHDRHNRLQGIKLLLESQKLGVEAMLGI
jgi:hypothetical protein